MNTAQSNTILQQQYLVIDHTQMALLNINQNAFKIKAVGMITIIPTRINLDDELVSRNHGLRKTIEHSEYSRLFSLLYSPLFNSLYSIKRFLA
jgi:hypothetical protein